MLRFLTLSFLILVFVVSSAFATPTAKDFGALPNIDDAALSPDGTQIAVLINQDGKYIIRVSSLSNLKDTSRLIALGKGQKPQYLKWVNDDRVIFSFWQSEKIGRTPVRAGYLFTLNATTMKGKILVKPVEAKAGISSSTDFEFRQFNNVVVDWLEDDPDHILMAYGDDNNRKPDLMRVNVESGRDTLVKRGMTGVQTWQTDQTGAPRVGQGRNETNGEWNMRIRDADGDKWRMADEFPGLSAGADIHGFTSNPNELIISSYQGRDTVGLYVYDLGQKKITRKIYHNDSYDATGVVLSSQSGNIIGARYISETPQIEMIGENDSVMSQMRAKFNTSIVQYVDGSERGEKTLFKVSSASDAGNLLLVSKGSDPINLGALRPKIKPNDLGVVVGVEYSARDGQTIPSFLTIPPAITDPSQLKNMPFIVLPHGGPYARDSKRFDYFAQFFATRGYGVLQMNFRGSEGYGKTFKESGRENWVVMQDDVEDGTKWLISEGLADPKRICIVGWSYGGYAALMGAAKTPELYNCAVSMAGLTDIKDFKNDVAKYRFGRESAKSFFGNGFEDKDDIAANSPVKLAERITIPVFLAHGKSDQVVHFDQYTRMKNALRRSGAKVTYMDFVGGDHYLSEQDDRQKFLIGVEKFLLKSNGKSEFAK